MIKQRQILLITGKTGSGKSTLFREMITSAPRALIIDTLSEYRSLTPAFPALMIDNDISLCRFLKDNHRRKFKIVYDPQTLDDDGGRFFEIAYTLNDCVIGVEELANYCRANYAPEFLKRIIRFGRHKTLSLFATTQRPNEIPPIIRAQINRLISFKQTEPRDIAFLRLMVGDRAFELQNLGQFEKKDFTL